MRFATVKKQSDITPLGVQCVADFTDGTVKVLTITDPAGNVLRVRVDSYSMIVEVPAPPATKKVCRLSGTVAGVPVSHDFDDVYQAQRARDNYLTCLRDPDKDAKLSIDTAVEVIDDSK